MSAKADVVSCVKCKLSVSRRYIRQRHRTFDLAKETESGKSPKAWFSTPWACDR